MKDKDFAELLESATQALEHAQGKRELRTTVLPPAPKPMVARDVRKLRTALKASQSVFASCINVSPKLVQAWESNRRSPEGPALLLLRLAVQDPKILLDRFAPPHTAKQKRRLKTA